MELYELIAKKSMQWDSEERFMLIWKEQLVVGHYDRDRGAVWILTPTEPMEQLDIVVWFNKEIRQDLAAEDKKDKDEDEEDRDRPR